MCERERHARPVKVVTPAAAEAPLVLEASLHRLKRKPSAVAESETMQERWTSRSVCVCVCV